MSYRILVSDTKILDPEANEEVLGSLDATVEITSARTPEEVATAAAAGEADALIVDARTQVTAEVFEAAETVRVVGRAGIGVDNVDVRAASDHGVTVVNVPDYSIEEVSTHAAALLLACLRAIPTYDRSVKAGEWDWADGQPIARFAGQTVGIVAFGAIGRRFAAKIRGFGVDLLAYDPYVPDGDVRAENVRPVGFEELLAESDVVSVHAPLTDETRGLFDAAAFRAMRDDAILVNTGRGPVVDESALVTALDGGELAGVGLDVRETEPPGESPLHGRDDVVLTPHAAWYSEDSREELTRTVATDVARVLRGETPENPVEAGTGW